MKKIIAIFIISAINCATEITSQIMPDSIYIGSLVTISISVINLNEGEAPIFPYIREKSDVYEVIEQKLHDNTCDYNLRFWETGLIKIPSLTISILKNKQEIYELQSGIIQIPVLSLINEENLSLTPIKPIHKFRIINPYMIFIYLLIMVLGILMAIYLFIKRKSQANIEEHSDIYITSIFEKTINDLKSLEYPKTITNMAAEKYYLELSYICRNFFRESLFIRATEMTSIELEIYFDSIDVNEKLIKSWKQLNEISDIAKYGGQLAEEKEFIKHKEDFINIITNFYQNIHNMY